MIDVEDYTQSVGSVMNAEKRYRYPLDPGAVRELWMMWKQRNPEAMEYIEHQARSVSWTSGRVSAKYLVEKLRYESGIKLNAVPFVDEDGNERRYGISNTLTHFIGVWLKERHPELKIEVKKSRFDRKGR
jgi:hypothetical protein